MMDDWLSKNHKSLNIFSVPLIEINIFCQLAAVIGVNRRNIQAFL